MVTDKALWLAGYLYHKKRATLDQIAEAWARENRYEVEEMPRRTFQETKKKVERLFGINIECDRYTHQYYFEDMEFFKKNDVFGWLFKTLSLTTTLQKYKNIREQILLEEPASGYLYLPDLLEGIEQSLNVEICYHPFNKDAFTTTLSPFCLKAFRKRWYVLGYSTRHGEERTFALDRIEGVQLTNKKFSIPDHFNCKQYFQDCFGVIYGSHVELCTIQFRATPQQIPYLRTKPLHRSQQELSEGVFQIRTYFTYEVLQEFLSYGCGIEILSPESVKERVKEEIEKMFQIYTNKAAE